MGFGGPIGTRSNFWPLRGEFARTEGETRMFGMCHELWQTSFSKKPWSVPGKTNLFLWSFSFFSTSPDHCSTDFSSDTLHFQPSKNFILFSCARRLCSSHAACTFSCDKQGIRLAGTAPTWQHTDVSQNLRPKASQVIQFWLPLEFNDPFLGTLISTHLKLYWEYLREGLKRETINFSWEYSDSWSESGRSWGESLLGKPIREMDVVGHLSAVFVFREPWFWHIPPTLCMTAIPIITSQLMNQMCWEILERSHTPIFTLHAQSHFFWDSSIYVIIYYIYIIYSYIHEIQPPRSVALGEVKYFSLSRQDYTG